MRLVYTLSLLLAASALHAQTTASLHVGAAEFDLSGTGTAPVLDVRLAAPLSGPFRVEGGLGLTNTDQQFGDVAYLLPNLELHAGFGSVVRPYLGVGVGAFVPITDPPETVIGSGTTVDYDPDTESYLSLVVGLDAPLRSGITLRTAGRVRGTASFGGPDFFSGTFSDLSVGVGYRF